MAQYERSAQATNETHGSPNTGETRNSGKGSVNAQAPGFALAGAAAQCAMRGNMELMSLASRRARAQLDLPRKAMACRSTTDFGQLSATFWREAFQDYLECNQRLMACWTQTLTDVGQSGLARSMTEFATVALQPMATVAEEAGAAVAEQPTEPWAWWRTDMKGIKPARNGNGHHNEMHVGP
jgi:hypothetical protein